MRSQAPAAMVTVWVPTANALVAKWNVLPETRVTPVTVTPLIATSLATIEVSTTVAPVAGVNVRSTPPAVLSTVTPTVPSEHEAGQGDADGGRRRRGNEAEALRRGEVQAAAGKSPKEPAIQEIVLLARREETVERIVEVAADRASHHRER